MKPCILYDRECIECGECRCELDHNKICDNCFRCLETDGGDGYAKIPIEKVYLSEDDYAADAETEQPHVHARYRIKTLPQTSGARFL